ncbi:SDR family oxidoreductase [Halobacillus litoralis]|uniref:NAD(P)-dependent oxidoreductase n=1 Tax=Halobacillus litoralis TaxID=45668 RepID=UPI001CD4AA7F|nr:NAD(P)-binding oxidoreductase [Halobacillus litoralis]MCA0972364.1 SDR family oxidoreductase [Halobacillus litoralis]
MKIIVFGATGKTGLELVSQALDSGHDVTAFVRTPSKLTLQHERLHTIQGDALDIDAVEKAISGHEAVASCLGSEGLKPSRVLEQMAGNIVKGMQKHGVSRIVYVASAGIHKEIPGFTGWMSQRILKNVLVDHRNAVNAMIAAKLDYTIARPMQLKDGERKETYRTAEIGVPHSGKEIHRSDVAHFLLEALENDQWIKQTVGLAY